uniref:Uncharacterized protein n=1 Tax=Arundo donax TaxID=35708 RepID=A0A0A9C5X2_ARUDO
MNISPVQSSFAPP